jgi:hypothetical protein
LGRPLIPWNSSRPARSLAALAILAMAEASTAIVVEKRLAPSSRVL